MPNKDKIEYQNYNRLHKIIYHDYYLKYEHKRYIEIKKELEELKSNGYSICGYNNNQLALQFHHVEPTEKKFKINTRNIRKKYFYDEIMKCVLLCANCHMEVHSQLSGDNIYDE